MNTPAHPGLAHEYLELCASVAAQIIGGASVDPAVAFSGQHNPSFLIVMSPEQGEAIPSAGPMQSAIVMLTEGLLKTDSTGWLSEEDVTAGTTFFDKATPGQSGRATLAALWLAHHRPFMAAQMPPPGWATAVLRIDAAALWQHIAGPLATWMLTAGTVPEHERDDLMAGLKPVGALPQPVFVTIPSPDWPAQPWNSGPPLVLDGIGQPVGTA